jgi:hypothetical protein
MARQKIAVIASLAILGLSAAPAQAFGPMMMGGHQHGGDTSHKDSTAGRADAPPAPVSSKHDEPADEGRSSSNSPVAPQHVALRDAHRSDAEHGR